MGKKSSSCPGFHLASYHWTGTQNLSILELIRTFGILEGWGRQRAEGDSFTSAYSGSTNAEKTKMQRKQNSEYNFDTSVSVLLMLCWTFHICVQSLQNQQSCRLLHHTKWAVQGSWCLSEGYNMGCGLLFSFTLHTTASLIFLKNSSHSILLLRIFMIP